MRDTRFEKEDVESFVAQNTEEGMRVFVAGGHRGGNDPLYIAEAYNLGREIINMDFKLDFGLSNSGIMGAVARGVMDGWSKKQRSLKGLPIQAITTPEYYSLYSQDDVMVKQIENVILAKTLEERKQKLLNADFVVFAPGGVGTLDELAYDCVAMQDGLLPIKPFIFYNVNGFFHHLLEFLKEIAAKGFAEPVPFIVVDNSNDLSVVFRLLKLRYNKNRNTTEAYANARQAAYELPYFIKRLETEKGLTVEGIIAEMKEISTSGTSNDRKNLTEEIDQAYLEKEIERMYDRLAKTGKDTSIVSDKLSMLKKRRQSRI